jgi:hypothetical protein
MLGEAKGIEAITRGCWALDPSSLAGPPYRKVITLVIVVGLGGIHLRMQGFGMASPMERFQFH